MRLTNLAPSECAIGRGLVALRPIGDSESKYYLYLIRRYQIELAAQGTGTTFEAISGNTLKNFVVPIAPLKQQKRIVDKIEKLFSHIDAGIKALQKAKQLLKQYRQSVLKAAVTGELTKEWRKANKDKLELASQLLERILKERRRKWEEKQLEQFKVKGKIPKGDKWKEKYKAPKDPKIGNMKNLPDSWMFVTIEQVAEVGTGATPLKGKKEYYENGSVPWVTSGALNELFVSESKDHITEFALEKTNVSLFPKHTLLVAMYGEGKTRGKVSELLIEAGTNQACAAIVLSGLAEKIRPFIKLFLEKNYDDIRRLSSGGVQPNLNLEIIRATKAPFPSLSEQKEVVRLVDEKIFSVNRLYEEIETQQVRAKKNKQSILAFAFKGEIE